MYSEQTFFRRLALATLVAVYILIVVGGIVRSTGSGMGCPDWPKCFGQWVPPTDESQLPADYKEKYAEKRLQKNIKLAGYLKFLGMDTKARQVVEDETVKEEQDFNKYKTMTEYVNRLVGAVIGLLVMATFIRSIRYFKSKPATFWIALSVFILTVLQGWIGSLVVSTNLLPWMVTVHMLLTFFIIAGLIYLVYISGYSDISKKTAVPGYFFVVLGLSIFSLLVQVVIGTQVREAVDEIAYMLQYSYRDIWISKIDWSFYFHRSFSWVVLILHLWLFYMLYKAGEKFWSTALMAMIILSIGTGVIMAYMAIPPAVQPVHLVLGVIIFGIQYYIFLIVRKREKIVSVEKG